MRIKIIRYLISSLFIVIALDLFFIQIIRGEYYFNLSVNNRIRIIPLEGRRGCITDRNGMLLSDTQLIYNVAVIPQDVKNQEGLFEYLSEILDVDKSELILNFQKKLTTPFAPVVVAEDVGKPLVMVLEENKFQFPGLYIQESYGRRYLFGNVGAHVIGYVGRINVAEIEKLESYGYSQDSIVGKEGVENYYDHFLRGRGGGLQIEVNNRGQQVRLLGFRDPENGQDIQLTIDQRIQKIASEVLGQRLGTIIIMEIETGEILGMVSSPSFDPNIFLDQRLNHRVKSIFSDSASPLLNRAIRGLYPPGSVFKIIVSVAALASSKITPQTSFFCNGSVQIGNRSFHCVHAHGLQDLKLAILNSCNVYFYNLGEKLGPDLMQRFAYLFGLGQLTQIDLPYEKAGLIPSRLDRKIKLKKDWYQGDTLNFAIGQGEILVTPLQLVHTMVSIARDGKEAQPHLIKVINEAELIKFSTIREIKVKPEIFKVIQSGLRAAVTSPSGTAHILDLEDFYISGKTGTAQSYQGRESHAWFVGYDIKGKHKIAFCIFLEHGGSSLHACELARELLMKLRQEEIL